MNEKVLFISPHPDDETLGCGGTILKHKASGDRIYWLIMTNMFPYEGYEDSIILIRKEEIKEVSQRYGFEETVKLEFHTTKLDTYPMDVLVQSISEVMRRIMPNIVYLPHHSDIHTDHQITFSAVMSSLKTFRAIYVRKVLTYETLSETEFVPALSGSIFIPNYFSDISEYIDEKIEIMKIYSSELDKHPFPRNIENIKALALLRGATSGVQYAESFMVLKEVW